jgi:hypothetical protein
MSVMTPKAVKLAWDGITKVIPLEPVNTVEQPDATLTKQIETVLKDCEARSHGAARNALFKDFTTEGGISTAKSQTFMFAPLRSTCRGSDSAEFSKEVSTA